ncbi:MAG: two-component regulator propeller domain-containing protein [Melioribacteraceae bacterium]
MFIKSKILPLTSRIILFLIIFPIILFSQTDDLRIEQISIKDGLSQGSVRCIMEDSLGFFWFGTHDGLNRYDGYTFKVYKNKLSDSTSISDNWIYCFAQNSIGDIWVGTADGLNLFIREQDRFIQIQSLKNNKTKLNIDAVYTLFINKEENEEIIYFSTNKGLVKYNHRKNEFKLLYPKALGNPSDGNYIRTIFKSKSGKILVGTSNGRIFYLNTYNNSFTHFDGYFYRERAIRNNSINSFYEDNYNNLWIATALGLNSYNYVTNEKKYLPDIIEVPKEQYPINIYSIAQDKSGNLWLGGLGWGIAIINPKNGEVISPRMAPNSTQTSLTRSVFCIYPDKRGLVWIGTSGDGISRLNHYTNRFNLVNSETGLNIFSVRTFFEDNYNNLYVGGYKGIEKFNKITNKKFYYSDKSPDGYFLENPNIYSMEEDYFNKGKFLWLGTEGNGIAKLNLITGKISNFPFKKKINNNDFGAYIYSLYSDSDHLLWAGTERGLFTINLLNERIEFYQNNPLDTTSIGPKSVTKILEDSYGNLWIGTNLGGLNLFNKKSKTFIRYTFDKLIPNSISNNNIKTIFEDSKKRLWIGTNGSGLNLYNRENKTFKRFTSEDGLPNDVIYGILEDSFGHLWISTNLGLSRFDPEKKEFVNYLQQDGLQSNEFNSNAYYKSPSGELYFGGIEGYNSFFPDKIITNKNIPSVRITKFKVFNNDVTPNTFVNGRIILKKVIELTDTITLKHNENMFTFEYAALDYVAPVKNSYFYKMENFDDRWINAGKNRTATYTNLNPGEYIFKVKATNNDGLLSNEGTSLTIIILPPFWKTWWFLTIALLVIISIIYFILWYRIKLIQEQKDTLQDLVFERTSELEILNKELTRSNSSKDRFFSIIAHDLRGPFNGFLGLSDMLKKECDTLSKDEIIDISNALHLSIKKTYNLLENLLNWARVQTGDYEYSPDAISLSNIVDDIHLLFIGNLSAKNIKFFNKISPELMVYADENMLNSILQNLISNAIKFTPRNGEIIINSLIEEKLAKIYVIDTGIGIDNEMITKIFNIDSHITSKGTENESGTGLGLVLIKELIIKSGGEINVESKIGSGTTFSFTIPIA